MEISSFITSKKKEIIELKNDLDNLKITNHLIKYYQILSNYLNIYQDISQT